MKNWLSEIAEIILFVQNDQKVFLFQTFEVECAGVFPKERLLPTKLIFAQNPGGREVSK